MFIITLTFLKSAEEIAAIVLEHRAFLREQYAQGVFLVSGRMLDSTGGIIVAHGASRLKIEAIAQRDPFYLKGISSHVVTEFTPTMTCELLSDLRRD